MPRIHKKILGSRNPSSSHNNNTVFIISNDEMGDIMKIVKYIKDSSLLIKGVTETVQNDVNEQKGGFLSVLLGTLGAKLLVSFFGGKGAIAKSISKETKSKSQGREIFRAGKSRGKGLNRAGEETVRAGYGHPLSSASNNNKMHF